MKIERDLIVLDLETTGTWVEKDKIIEIGMVRLSPDGKKEEYLKRINPGLPIPEAVSRLTGIKDEDVKDQPSFAVLAEEILGFLTPDADLSGFNVERFDLPLLEREFFDAGFKFEWRGRAIYDTQKIYHYYEKRDLTAAYKFYCGKDLQNAHSAMADTQAALEILRSQVGKYGAEESGLASLKGLELGGIPADYFDEEKRFRWWNGQLYPLFGKHARKKSVQELVKKDPAYLRWILESDFSDKIKAMVQKALKGEMPQMPKKDLEKTPV